MSGFQNLPKPVLRLIKQPPRIVYALGLGPIIGRIVLLLTTTGRKTGLKRVTSLQYEEVDGAIYLGASRGLKSDWVRNILADPHVEVQLKAGRFTGLAEVVTDLDRVTDFIELRLQHRPRMVGAMLKAEGLPNPPGRADLETYAKNIVLVIVHPQSPADENLK